MLKFYEVDQLSIPFPSSHKMTWRNCFRQISIPALWKMGRSSIERAAKELEEKINQILDQPLEKQTFENTAVAYHRAIKKFDAAERLIRSERLIVDQTPGKKELLDRCIQVKDQTFADRRLIDMFLSFAKKMNSEEQLSPFEWECVKGILHSVRQEQLPAEFSERVSLVH